MRKTSNNKQAFVEGRELSQQSQNNILPDIDESSIDKMMMNEQSANQDNVKELFHEDKVKARSEINSRQIRLITKAYYLAKITGMKEIHEILNDFLVLSISKDRKSRAEFVEGLKARIEQSIATGNMRGQFGK